VVVFCLQQGVCSIARMAGAGSPTAVVVDEDCEPGSLEALGKVGNVVLFEES
jgi:hypothetical protein